MATAVEVEDHLKRYSLVCKTPESVCEGTRVLGIKVWGEHHGLIWKHVNEVPNLQEKLTRWIVFSICGQLTSHLPVCGWLHVASS